MCYWLPPGTGWGAGEAWPPRRRICRTVGIAATRNAAEPTKTRSGRPWSSAQPKASGAVPAGPGGAGFARAVTARLEISRLDDRVLLPDFRGFTVAEVRQIAASSQLAIRISGSGRAIAQEPPPGTVLAVGGAPVRVRFQPGVSSGDGREG